jgi:hypothetical protein
VPGWVRPCSRNSPQGLSCEKLNRTCGCRQFPLQRGSADGAGGCPARVMIEERCGLPFEIKSR